jgi:putative sterol carrier protein
MCHEDEETAIERGIDGAHFFGYSLAHYYVFGEHEPDVTNVWEEFLAKRADYGFAREIINADDGPLGVKILEQGFGSLRGAIGTPDQITELARRYQDAGVDQMIFVSQAGPNRHEHICESLELFGKKVLPNFVDGREEREAAKRERLAEACERALARRSPARAVDRGYTITPLSEPAPAQLIAAARRAETHAAADGRPRNLRERLAGRLRTAGESAFAAFVSKRSDAQIDRIFGSSAGLRLMFKGMERAFVPEKANGFKGDVQYEFTGANGLRSWFVRIDGDHAKAEQGRASDPVIVFRSSVPMFTRLASGEVHPGKAMMEGRLEVEGNFEAAAKLAEMFGQQSLV